MLKQLGQVTTFLRKSNISTDKMIKDAKASGDDDRRLRIKGAGNTRFATHWSSSCSFEPHLRPVQRLVETGGIQIKV